jgi:signal transduction histidine kinase/DNA-binding response OmpR family regulator
VKKVVIISSVFVLILLIGAFIMISRLLSQQLESNAEVMMKRANSISKSIESDFNNWLDETDFYVTSIAYRQLLSDNSKSGESYHNLMRFFIKYQHLISAISISDGKVSRSLNKTGYNRIIMNDIQPDTTRIISNRNWVFTPEQIVYTYPVFNATRATEANIKFTINLQGFIQEVLIQDNVDRYTWIFFADNEKILYTQSYNPIFEKNAPIQVTGFDNILSDTRRGLADSFSGKIVTGDQTLKAIYAYEPINLFNQSFTLIYAQEKIRFSRDIYTVIIILSVIFLFILIIAYLLFSSFIRILKKEEDKLLQIQSAVENASDLILITNMQKTAIFSNKAFRETLGLDGMSENPLSRIVKDTAIQSQIQERITQLKSWSGEIEIQNQMNESTTCLLRADIIHDKENKPIAVMYMATDIAERKKAERMKNEFISTVSHELRTPLTSIRGSLGLIRGGVTGEVPKQTQKLIDIAYTNSERLVRLINDILDIEKIEAGKMEFHIQKLEVLPLVEKTIEMMRNYAQQFNVTIKLKKALALYSSYVDADRFEQILVNLISNAAKFSPSGATVEVAMTMSSQSVMRLSVSDKGIGIPEEFRSMMFKKFAQVDSSDSKSKGGTGLGLSISKAIVEKFGGKIDYESVQNKGTTFYIEIPVIAQQETIEEVVSDNDMPRILIVEDDADIAALLKMILEDAGYQTSIAYNAEEAMEKLSQYSFAAMTLDLMLPDKQGITLVQELRDAEKTTNLPIIVVSAVADQQKQQFHGGFDILDWIQKPIDLTRLKRVLQSSVFPKGSDKYVILHVEDDLDNIEIVTQILKDKADIIPAHTLLDAKSKIKTNNFDLIILDMSLPDGNGMDLIPALRQYGKQTTPVLVFSASDTPNDLQDLVCAALVKSKTNNDELVQVIQAILNSGKPGIDQKQDKKT